MSTTLTARVSVRVQAKNTTQSDSQKRDTGKNIAKALGNENISDELADEIGNTTNPTIADENGNEWVSMEDIIAAGKKMKENGAFDEEEIHEGLDDGNITYNLSGVALGPAQLSWQQWFGGSPGSIQTRNIPSEVYYIDLTNGSHHNVYAFSKTSFTIISSAYNITPSASTVTIGNTNYSMFVASVCGFYEGTNNNDGTDLQGFPSAGVCIPNNAGSYQADINKCIAGYLFGPSHTTGGSLIDWTKPDAEIEEEIRQLHETWDVTTNPAITESPGMYGDPENKAYVLAGPIEYD